MTNFHKTFHVHCKWRQGLEFPFSLAQKKKQLLTKCSTFYKKRWTKKDPCYTTLSKKIEQEYSNEKPSVSKVTKPWCFAFQEIIFHKSSFSYVVHLNQHEIKIHINFEIEFNNPPSEHQIKRQGIFFFKLFKIRFLDLLIVRNYFLWIENRF